jgi:hypothetical protein
MPAIIVIFSIRMRLAQTLPLQWRQVSQLEECPPTRTSTSPAHSRPDEKGSLPACLTSPLFPPAVSYNMLFHRNLSPRLLSLPSTCCVIVATRGGDLDGLTGIAKTGRLGNEAFLLSRSNYSIRQAALCTCFCTNPHGRTVSKHSICARTHFRPPNPPLSPYPPRPDMLCTKNPMRLCCRCTAGLKVLPAVCSLVRHSTFISRDQSPIRIPVVKF